MAYKRLTDTKPAAMSTVRNTIAAGAAEADTKAEGINNTLKFIKHQLFLAGLKDGIRDKVLEAAKATFNESVKVAGNLKTIQNDHKRLNKINTIRNETEEEKAKEIPWDSLSDDQLSQLAAIHFGRNRYNNNGNNNGNNNRNNNRNNQGNNRPMQLRNPNTECRYCKKKGHLQKDCFSWKRDQASMVDANGKPYQQNNHVNNVADQPAAAQTAPAAGYEDAFIGSVANLCPYHHLNW
jgi:hypothetical protein